METSDRRAILHTLFDVGLIAKLLDGGLLQVAADRGVNIAVVATSRRAGRAMLWNESFAARLIERGELPVLLARRADEDEDV